MIIDEELAQLRASVERYRIFFEQSYDAVFIHALTGEILDVNKRACEIYGFTREEALRLAIGDLSEGIAPYSQSDAIRWIEAARRDGPQRLQWRTRRFDGALFWAEVSLNALEVDGTVRVIASVRDISEIKNTEIALRASEEKFRLIMASMQDIVFTLDRDQKHTGVYGPWVQRAGFTPDYFLGKSAVELFGVEAGAIHAENNRKALAGEYVVYEWSAPGSGGRAYFQTSLSPIVSEAGEVIGIVGVGRNVTKQKAVEEAYLASEKAFRSLVENAPIGIYRSSPSGETLLANSALAKILGYESPEEMVRSHRAQSGYGNPEDRDVFVRLLEGGRQLRGYETVWKRRDGSLVDVRENARCVLNDQGEALYYEGTAEDITELKAAEEALRESESRFRSLASMANEGVMIHRSGLILEANDAAALILGLGDPSEIIGRNGPEIVNFTAESRERIRFHYENELDDAYEIEFTKPNGENVIAETWGRSIIYRDAPARLIYIRDITERRAAEGERERLQAQLNQAMKMESIGRLAGGVAHDFNNLLTAITGNVALAMMDVEQDSPLAEPLAEIENAARRAASLTQQLLAFSRKQVVEPRVLNVNEVIGSLRSMLTRLIGEDIDLKMMPGEPLDPVKIDPGQLEQIIVNLIVNARDAMPSGGKLLIETYNAVITEEDPRSQRGLKPGRYVGLSVADTGLGMSEEVQRKIFEPFFTTKPAGKGTGLGLATVYGIVKQAEGDIIVYSNSGKGSIFKILIPSTVRPDVVDEVPQGGSSLLTGSEVVLLVEDEEQVRMLASRYLQRLNYIVHEAGSGMEALEKAAEIDRIDLLLTDVVMPGMNGRQLADLLSSSHPEAEVLFTSGYTENVIVHHGMVDSEIHFIPKPYTPSALALKLREILDRRNASASGGE